MRRRLVVATALVAALLVGAKCGGGGGSGGGASRVVAGSSTPACTALFSIFPPGFDFVPGGGARALVATDTPNAFVQLDGGAPLLAAVPGTTTFALPDDVDSDGRDEGSLFVPRPRIDDVEVLRSDLAVLTTSGYEALVFVDPRGALVPVDVSVDGGFGPDEFRLLPAPGTTVSGRTGVANFHCLVPPAGARDSRGDLLSDPTVLSPAAWCAAVPSYRASFTSGVALAGGHLFVPVSNLGDVRSQGAADSQFLPGAVLVYDLDLSATPPRVAPNTTARALFTHGYNPTHATPYTTPAGRELVLVSVTGAIGIAPDDPLTPAPEGGTLRLGEGSVEVIDASTLAWIARIPLGLANPSFRDIAIDPGGRVALLGDVADRQVLAVDLAPLAGLPASPPAPVVLDGVGGPRAAIFDAALPLVIPGIAGGAPGSLCPGRIESLAFNAAGTRAFALDSCNGTLTPIEVDLSGTPAVPVPTARFRVGTPVPVAAPLGAAGDGRPQQPASVAVRPGVPGVDYSGPDVFFTIGQPEGQWCGIRVDSPR